MSPDAVPVPIEELLRHRAWVQGLARTLVRDPAAADDLEQEAWVAALEHPPTRPHGVAGVRSWLGRVLRNRAADGRRARGRRDRHEAAAPPRSATPSAAETVARAETHRRVVEAVMRLEEPLRTAVVLRFFEGLPPREVARRTGVPTETARTRIGRGVERLRERLAGAGDERARSALWAFAFAPSPIGIETSGGALGPVAAKGGIVALSAKQAVAIGIAVAAAVGGVVLPPRWSATTEPATASTETAARDAAMLAAQGRATPTGAPTVTAEATRPTAARGPVQLVVRREDGAPVGGTAVSLETDGIVAPSVRVGDDGALVVAAFDRPRVAYVAVPDAALRRFAIPASVERLELVVPMASVLTGSVLVDGEVPTERLVLGLRTSEPSVTPEALPLPSPFDPWSIAVATDARGAFRATGLPREGRVAFAAPTGYALESPTVVRAPSDGVVVRLRRLPRLRGRIVRGGTPLRGATAAVPWTDGRTSGQVSTETDEAGRFTLVLEAGAPKGTTLLLADAYGLARAERTLPAERGLDTDLGDLELEDPWADVMRIMVVGADGRAVAGAVAMIPGDPSWKSPPAGSDGLLRLPARIAHGMALVGSLGHRTREVVLTPSGDATVRVVLEPAALLRIHVDGLGDAREGAMVRVSGSGRIFDEPESHAALELREAVGGTHASSSVRAEEGDFATFSLEGASFGGHHYAGVQDLVVPWVLPARAVRLELADRYGETLTVEEVRLERGEDRMFTLEAKSPARRVYGIVRGPRGLPVVGAGVFARAGTRGERDGGGLPGPLVVLATDDAGRFTLEGVHGTMLDLFVGAPDLCPWTRRTVTLPTGDRPLEVTLEAGRTLTVRLRGGPAEHVDVWAESLDPGSWTPGFRPFGGELREDGSIRIACAPLAAVEVVVRTADGETRKPAPAGIAEVEVDLPKEK